jgi:hypothetical protein
MTALTEKIYNEVLDLPTDERLSLIDKLLQARRRRSPAEPYFRKSGSDSRNET